MKSKIIKIGKDFKQFLNKSLDFLFPIQLLQLGKKLFYQEIEINHNKNANSATSQVFQFYIWDSKDNLRSFIFHYKIYPDLTEGIFYVDGFYQLGKEELLLTEEKENQELIVAMSIKVDTSLVMTQNFIKILSSHKISINIKDLLIH